MPDGIPPRRLNQDEATVRSILIDLGLTENEADVYLSLIEHGSMSAGDMLRNLNLRQPQLYDITSSLERKGFINAVEGGRPKRFEAISQRRYCWRGRRP
ncbi:TrmB family transcriptional regulator [Thermogymnomonas acidicola]|uniref:helix-turn-helix domain-containing protein n=1 Tax=Thermogymnomonas acidicola TaxID=399579 RepID=UPI0009465E55|nr:helix-turn-helix domain-containing protein [Thermogymnomonas acidicola]